MAEAQALETFGTDRFAKFRMPAALKALLRVEGGHSAAEHPAGRGPRDAASRSSLGVGPFGEQGAVEPFYFAVGLWPVRPGPLVADVGVGHGGGPVLGPV